MFDYFLKLRSMNQLFVWTENFFNIVAVLIIIIGSIRSIPLYFAHRKDLEKGAFTAIREGMGKTIILSLEFLIIADIIRSVANEPTLLGVSILGIIIIIRSFLSLELQTELEGRLPWKKYETRI